jgi:hypothetical protein
LTIPLFSRLRQSLLERRSDFNQLPAPYRCFIVINGMSTVGTQCSMLAQSLLVAQGKLSIETAALLTSLLLGSGLISSVLRPFVDALPVKRGIALWNTCIAFIWLGVAACTPDHLAYLPILFALHGAFQTIVVSVQVKARVVLSPEQGNSERIERFVSRSLNVPGMLLLLVMPLDPRVLFLLNAASYALMVVPTMMRWPRVEEPSVHHRLSLVSYHPILKTQWRDVVAVLLLNAHVHVRSLSAGLLPVQLVNVNRVSSLLGAFVSAIVDFPALRSLNRVLRFSPISLFGCAFVFSFVTHAPLWMVIPSLVLIRAFEGVPLDATFQLRRQQLLRVLPANEVSQAQSALVSLETVCAMVCLSLFAWAFRLFGATNTFLVLGAMYTALAIWLKPRP